ncbi:MAG: hypothetical protein WC552_03615 [Candidatus Omnitrophota bacterium]
MSQEKVGLQSVAIWVDLLCWESAWWIFAHQRRGSLEEIHYLSRGFFGKAFKGFLSWWFKAAVEEVNTVIESEEKVDGISVYESVQNRITEVLDNWVKTERIAALIRDESRKYGLNTVKLMNHLKEAAYFHVFRPVEMSLIVRSRSHQGRAIVLLRKTPFAPLFLESLDGRLSFYHSWISPGLPIVRREGYHYDVQCNPRYYGSRLNQLWSFVEQWFSNALSGALGAAFFRVRRNSDNQIGVELTQHRVRLQEINDISWIQDSGIELKNICGIEMETFDSESVRNLNIRGIPRFKVGHDLRCIIKQFKKPKNQRVSLVVTDGFYGLKTLFLVLSLARFLFVWNENSWISFQKIRYICRSEYWLSIYRKLGIKLLWTMYDVDEDKLAKGQAIEKRGGIYTGGHWSNFPMYRIYYQKCFDVVFTWGEHFISNNFSRYPFLDVFLIGYPCDYYFQEHKPQANALRAQYPGRFILSYHDNSMGKDLPYSRNMQIEIYKVLLAILKEFGNVVVFLKPKRKAEMDEMMSALPELKSFADDGRVAVFLGDTRRTKAVPAEIGMASDLVVGLGISTAAAESFFAGTTAFHADFTCFERNSFAQRGLGKIVFRDAVSLKRAIVARITKEDGPRREDYREYYNCLDPFQDGLSGKRMGFLVKKMQEYLSQGVPREEAVKLTAKDYKVFLDLFMKPKVLV